MYYKTDDIYECEYEKAAQLFAERWQLKRRREAIEDKMLNHSNWRGCRDNLDCF